MLTNEEKEFVEKLRRAGRGIYEISEFILKARTLGKSVELVYDQHRAIEKEVTAEFIGAT